MLIVTINHKCVNFHVEVVIDCGSYSAHNGRCYKYYSDVKTYLDAQATCQLDGATLAEVGSSPENTLLGGTQSEGRAF